jgi:hypothetical protein
MIVVEIIMHGNIAKLSSFLGSIIRKNIYKVAPKIRPLQTYNKAHAQLPTPKGN